MWIAQSELAGLNRIEQWLTSKAELVGKDAEEDVAVHGEQNGEVGTQRAPHKKMVNGCPVASVQGNLHTYTQREYVSMFSLIYILQHTLHK